MIDVRLLGAVEAHRDHEPVSLGGRGPTTLLALLALNPGEVVAIDRIIDAVWEGEPPATAVNTVQVYVSRLRRALGESEAVLTRRPGYLLSLERASVDAFRFDSARYALDEGDRCSPASGRDAAAKSRDRLALMKLDGYSNQDIADHIGRNVRSVERKLKLIRSLLSQDTEDVDGG